MVLATCLLVTGIGVPAARATVDFTGRWHVTITDANGTPVTQVQDWVQSGTDITATDTGSGDTVFAGSIDPSDDRRFALASTAQVCGSFGTCCARDTLDGTVDVDGGRWDGSSVTHAVLGPGPHCVPLAASAAVGIRPGGGCSECTSDCAATPQAGCRHPIQSGKASLALNDDVVDAKEALAWKWTKGEVTPQSDFGDPRSATTYQLCVYDGTGLRLGLRMAAGAMCGGAPCWKARPTGFTYDDHRSDGRVQITLRAGAAPGQAAIAVKAKGAPLALPNLTTVASPLIVQLHNPNVCWEAIYSAPSVKQSATQLRDKAD